jgi:ubiquinone/menaquinone biosynthesis C-methylase UbiE
LTCDEIAQILEIPHFKHSRERDLDIARHYRSYVAGFVSLLEIYRLPGPRVIADIGTGYGWLAAALARNSDAHIIAVDNNEPRIKAARRLAAILGAEQSVEWRIGGLPDLPLADQEADVVFCVEVIEHVGVHPTIVRDLGRVTRDMLVISSPNRNCPVINHDTGLPFCHWLPLSIRDRYAALFRRKHLQENNRFWSPSMVAAALPEFERTSRFLQFPSYRDFLAAEAQIDAIPQTSWKSARSLRMLLLRSSALFGRASVQVLPNLASTFRRKVAPL